MKKLVFGLIASVMLAFNGNAQEVKPNQTSEFYNFVIQKSKLAGKVEVISIENLNELNYKKLVNISEQVNKENLDNSTQVELIFKDKKFTLYNIPISDYKVISFLEYENVVDVNPVETEITPTYEYTRNSFSTESRFGNSRDCRTGGSQVTAIGGAIAFAGFFGCAPCFFVGGAIAVLGSMSAFCP